MFDFSSAMARLSPARAFLAGAAILAGAAAPSALAQDTTEDVAMALPRVALPSLGGMALPQPLSPSEAQRIRRIFAHQASNDIPAAVAETEHVENPILLGHILADRYLAASRGKAAGLTTRELSDWLASYADLPDAPAIRGLLLSASAAPPRPKAGGARLASLTSDGAVKPLIRNPVLDRSVLEPARDGSADRALRLISRTRGLDAVYGAQLRAEVAQVLFSQGNDTEALRVAEAAHRQARGQVGLAPYVAGLAAWRLSRVNHARALFEAAYHAPLMSPDQRSGAAFWAARAHQRSMDAAEHGSTEYMPWMVRAAANPSTFYGLLARRSLGWGTGNEALPDGTLGEADLQAVAETPSGARAFALLQVGQTARAEAELRRLFSGTQGRPGFGRSIFLVAQASGLDALAGHIASVLQPQGIAMRLPTSRLRPAGGFRVDPALIYGMARVESNFESAAVSPAGARGLLQMMPLTAEYVMRDSARPGQKPIRLDDPATNLDLGQRYLLQLAQYDSIGSDLIRVLASYNSGPGSYARWAGGIRHNGDPLLFIESVPIDETRQYVQRALAYSWLYAARLRLPSPSLDELAAGAWPRFTPRVQRSDAVLQH